MEKHAIGIVIKDRLNFTLKCLESLIQYDNKTFDLFVIDNKSNPKIFEYIDPLLSKLPVKQMIHLEKELNIPTVWNKFLYDTKKYHYRTKLDNDIIVTDKYVFDNMIHSCSKLDLVAALPLNFPLKFSRLLLEEFECKPYLYGACLMITKKCFETIGYFDENLERMVDVDYSKRSLKKGLKIGYANNTYVSHLGSGKTGTTEGDWDEVLRKVRISKKQKECRSPARSIWENK